MKIRLEIEGKTEGSINYRGHDAAELAAAYLSSTDADEVQVHLVSDDGTKADAEFSGDLPGLSAARFIMSAVKSKINPLETSFSTGTDEPLTLKERLEMFLRFEYPGRWFSSLDVKRQYENVYGKISLSTVSTYLARMYRDNILERRGNRTQREYRFKDETALPAMEHVSIK